MSLFDGIDLSLLFDNESEYGKSYTFGPLTDEMIERAEKKTGYKLPASYIELLRFQNGGLIDDERLENSWLTAVYGIGETADQSNSLEDMYDNWRYEWEYPDIGIPFGETQSGGHDMYYMDFRSVDEKGEPRIVCIENEDDNAVYYIAHDLPEFIGMILRDEEIHGERIE